MVETRSGRRFAVVFFLAAFLVLLLGHWIRPVSGGALSVAAPFESVINTFASAVGDTVNAVVNGPRLQSELTKMRHDYSVVLRQDILLQQQASDNKLFRRMLQYDEANNHTDFLTARVIGVDPNDPLSQYRIINRGRRDGLVRGMTVVDQNGYFVGTISDVVSNASKVLLMTSPSSSIGALDLRTQAGGVVDGKFGARPQFEFVVSRTKLHKYDLVVTSGQLNLNPRTILLGQIMKISQSNDALFQTAEIQPAADLENLEMVQVIRNFSPNPPEQLLRSK